MLSFVQHRNRVRMLTGNRLDDPRCGDIINMVLERLYAYSWSFRKKESVLITVAPYATGTVALNVDHTKIDGTGTGWTSALIGRYVRIQTDVGFYRITNVVGQQLTLETTYASTFSATASYSIFKHIYSLAADVDVTQSMSYWRKLSEDSIESSDRFDARRTYSSSFPWSFIYRGNDSAGVVQVEIRPVPSAALPIRYAYIAKAPTLVPGTDDATLLPIEADVLDYFAAAEGLYVWAAEHPEVAGIAQLLSLADRREKQGTLALQEALYADGKKAGMADAGRDVDLDGSYDNDFAWSHDIGF